MRQRTVNRAKLGAAVRGQRVHKSYFGLFRIWQRSNLRPWTELLEMTRRPLHHSSLLLCGNETC